jgi:hypothetical protein
MEISNTILDEAKKAKSLAMYTYHCLYGFDKTKDFESEKARHGEIAYYQVLNQYKDKQNV